MNSDTCAAPERLPLSLSGSIQPLYVVVGGTFNGLDASSIFFIEASNDFIKVIARWASKSRNFLDCCLAASFCSQRTNLNTELQQAILLKIRAAR